MSRKTGSRVADDGVKGRWRIRPSAIGLCGTGIPISSWMLVCQGTEGPRANHDLGGGIGLNESDEREALGLDVDLWESGMFCKDFLRRLVAGGLRGMLFVVQDAHQALQEAIQTAPGSTLAAHFNWNLLGQALKGTQPFVTAMVRISFVNPMRVSTKSARRLCSS